MLARRSEDAVDATAAQMKQLYVRLGRTMNDTKRWAAIGATPDDRPERHRRRGVHPRRRRGRSWPSPRRRGLGPGLDLVTQPRPGLRRGLRRRGRALQHLQRRRAGTAGLRHDLQRAARRGPDHGCGRRRDGARPDARRPRIPANSPYPRVAAHGAVPEGYKVVWKGNVYQAKWFNQGVDPSTTSAASGRPRGRSSVRSDRTTRPRRSPPCRPGACPTWDPTTLYEKGTHRRLRRPPLPGPVDARRATRRRRSSRSARRRRGSRLFQVPGEPATSE